MKGHFKGRAIILSRRDVGEADRIIRVFFAEHGREALSARGVRKPQAKLRGMLEPAMEVELQCVESRGMPVVTGATIIEPHEKLMYEYAALVTAQGLLEITEKTIAEHNREIEWYEFLRGALTLLSMRPEDEQMRRLVWVVALIKNLHSHGLSPVLRQELHFLRIQDGIFAESGGVELSEAAIKLWRICRDYEVEQLSRVQGVAEPLAELEPIIQSFWSVQTGIDHLRTRSLAGF